MQLGEDHRKYYMESLCFPEIDARHATIRSAHAKTCRWLLEKSEYRDWLDVDKATDHHGFLWIRGKPGSGKSTLMKFAVANVRKSMRNTIVVTFFFNARGGDLEKSTLGMYRSLLFQIFKAIPDLQKILDPIESIASQGGSYPWREDNLKALFETAIRSLGQHSLTCFIDALDECEEGQIRDLVAFLEQLGQIATLSQTRFHVLLSSRHYPHVSIRNGIEMTLQDQEGHTQDIVKYLISELKVGRGAQTDKIKEEILERSSGIFLWVALVVQILNKEYDHGRGHALRKRLREIPDGLDKLFEDILMRDQENKEDLLLCLQLILYARRPLKREELYHAIAFETDLEALSDTNPEEIAAQDMDKFIISCSKGLAETTKLKAQTVQFIHESVRDFLLGKNGLNKLKIELGSGLSHDRLKECCCKHIEIDKFWFLPDYSKFPKPSPEEATALRESISKNCPFLEYAVRNVLHHAEIADGQDVSQQSFVRQFDRTHWIWLDNIFEKYQIRRHTKSASLLYILAEKDLSSLIQTQIDCDVFPNILGEYPEAERYTAPLYAALANPSVTENTIQALLSPYTQKMRQLIKPATVPFKISSDCLDLAVQTLLQKRPMLDPQKGKTLIRWAISEGDENLVNLLLAIGKVEPGSNEESNESLLIEAATHGREKLVRFFLAEERVDPGCRGKHRATPLLRAAKNGHESIVHLLLAQKRVKPRSRDDSGRTPLSWAAANGHEDIVRLLLAQEGDDLQSGDDLDQTPLSLAVANGHEGIARLLLAREGVDPESRDFRDQTPLSLAIEKPHEGLFPGSVRGHAGLVRLLLAHETVDPNSRDYRGRTPLRFAIEARNVTIIRLLLERKDIELNSQDKYGATPLQRAVRLRCAAVVRLLLERSDIDPNPKDGNGKTPLFDAAFRLPKDKEIFKLLLMHKDIKPNAKDQEGRTPLILASFAGDVEMVRLLLEHDKIDLMLADRHGDIAMSAAVAKGNEAVARLLREKLWRNFHVDKH